MFKTILAAIDGSANGDRVAKKTGELAAISGGRLILAYIADPGVANDDLEMLAITEHLEPVHAGGRHPAIGGIPGWFDTALSNPGGTSSIREVLEKLGAQVLERAEYLAVQNGAEKVEQLIEDGDPASRLLEIAERENVDLIALGTRGLGRIKEIRLGSVSHKVVMMAQCPCLIMK